MDYFDAFTTIARRHVSEARMEELVQKFGGRGEECTDCGALGEHHCPAWCDDPCCEQCFPEKFGGRGPVNQIEDGSHTQPEDRPMEPFQTTADHIWVDGVCLYPDAKGWVHGVGCPCDACQQDAWVSAKEAARTTDDGSRD